MNEMVGEFAGLIWRALEGKNALSQKEIKKAPPNGRPPTTPFP